MITLHKPSLAKDRTRNPMVHVQCTGCGQAVCGTRLNGIPLPDKDVDCHVCAELEYQACPHCGLG